MGAGADKDAHGKGRCSCWRNCNRNRPGEGRDNAVLSLLVRGRRSESVHAGPLGKAITPLPVSFAPTISRCSKTSRLSLGRFFFFFFPVLVYSHFLPTSALRASVLKPVPHPSSSSVTTAHQRVGGGCLHSVQDCPGLLKTAMLRDSKVIPCSTRRSPWLTTSTKEKKNTLFSL